MTSIATPAIIFLFEDEVREAGRRLAILRTMRRTALPDDDAIAQAMCDALNACMTALNGAERDDCSLMMTSKAALGLQSTTPEEPL